MNKNYIVRGGKLKPLPLSPLMFARSSLFQRADKIARRPGVVYPLQGCQGG